MKIIFLRKIILSIVFIIPYFTECMKEEETLSYKELVVISHYELNNDNQTIRNKFKEAAQDGLFYLEIPEENLPLLTEALEFCNNFYKQEKLITQKPPEKQPNNDNSHYLDSKDEQIESFAAGKNTWKALCSIPLQNLGNNLVDLSLKLLTKILSIITDKDNFSDMMTHTYTHTFIFNHYRPNKEAIGAFPHTDPSLLSLLFVNKKGLHAQIRNKQWQSILPKPGYLIIMYGSNFLKLLNNPEKLIACTHIVEHLEEERVSFLLQINTC